MQGVIAQIAPASPQEFDVGKGRTYPPILWVHMAKRDQATAGSVAQALKICK